ncbi:MAG: type II secretion system protein [Gemmatimonadaceae bacterium]|nr:type II secretion system protein [Gemmatimonadaceae bacterium]
MAARRGFTLLELTIAGALIGIISLMALPTVAALRDRAAVHGATSLLVSALADARHQALRWQRRTAVRFDTTQARTVVHAGSDTLVRIPLDSLFRVALATTRDSIAFYPTGLGYGAANTRLIVARGAAAETVTVSRAGRVKR